jgi:hypothetical protein
LSTSAAAVRRGPPVDPRCVRFSAALTTVVLALVLVSGSGWLLAAQALVFALGSVAGLRFAPYSASSPLHSRWPPPSSTPLSASAWAARPTA